MTEEDGSIVIPPGCSVEVKMEGSATVNPDECCIEIPMRPKFISQYKCTECGFTSDSVEIMTEHHTWHIKHRPLKLRIYYAMFEHSELCLLPGWPWAGGFKDPRSIKRKLDLKIINTVRRWFGLPPE